MHQLGIENAQANTEFYVQQFYNKYTKNQVCNKLNDSTVFENFQYFDFKLLNITYIERK